MSELIPPYLDDGESVFIRLAKQSKAPKKGNSASDGPFFSITDSEIQSHIQNGGNVGRVFRDDIIALDVDHRTLLDELDSWPDTLVIESGGDGLGCHYYYRVPTWNQNQTELSANGVNIGSIRSGNSYCLVPPSRHDETGNRYEVSNPRNPAEISVSRLSSLIDKYGNTANTGGGPGGDRGSSAAAAPGVGGASEPIPDEYPNRGAEWNTLRSWLRSNGFLEELNKSHGDRSGREFKLAKCLAEGGFSKPAISQVLDRLPHDSKWHEEGSNYRRLTVQKAIESACNDPYIEFTTPNDDKERGRDLSEGESGQSATNMDYTTKDSLTVYNGSSPEATEEGETAIRLELVNMAGKDDSGNNVDNDFVSFRKGKIVDDGDFGMSVDLPPSHESNSLGGANPDDLRLLAEGIEELADELE